MLLVKRMYKIEYLPIAQKDMTEIVTYISQELSNTVAANKLAEEMVASAEKLEDFPYANVLYVPIKPLKNEYRKLLVKNFIMFYWVDEDKKTITIARIVYSKRDFSQMLQ